MTAIAQTITAVQALNVPADTSSAEALSQAWQRLCERYLPFAPVGSIWRYSRAPQPDDPEQGWKLHVSATVLNAHSVLERIGPVLADGGVKFKAPVSLQELRKINAGLQQGYSQVGKIITVYPRTPAEAMAWAQRLHELTCAFAAPVIPFDLRLKPDSNVYYRYGAFRHWETETSAGQRTPALRDPQGNLTPDLRACPEAKPAWVENPFLSQFPPPCVPVAVSPLNTTYRAFRALAQRGKGGVYQALDLSVQPPRFCLLKEGRRHGELGWDGRDGCWRIAHEEQVLARLRASGIAVPRVYASFELEGNRYLVTEFIEGQNLQTLLDRQQRRLPLSRVLHYGREIANLVAAIHAAGWVWRDCKPSNLLLTAQAGLRPIDFEGACPLDQPDPLPWGTPIFAPPDSLAGNTAKSTVYDDLYTLGAVIYLLLAGRLPEDARPTPLEKLRRQIPAAVRAVVMELLTAPPRQRPAARAVAQQLKTALLAFERPAEL